MLEETLIERLRAMPIDTAVKTGDGVFTREDKAAIDAAYFSIKGKAIRKCSCRHRYADALMEIFTELNIKPLKTMKKYIMRAGFLIWLDDEPLTPANITDKKAAKWCRLHPDRVAEVFSRYPETAKTKNDESEVNTEVEQEI